MLNIKIYLNPNTLLETHSNLNIADIRPQTPIHHQEYTIITTKKLRHFYIYPHLGMQSFLMEMNV